jgi:hypothetical protein
MPTVANDSKTIPQNAAQFEAHHTTELFNTVRDYLSVNEVDDHIAALSSAFASHIDFVTDEDEDCLTIPVELFKVQAYAFMDVIGLLCTIKKHWQLSSIYHGMKNKQTRNSSKE